MMKHARITFLTGAGISVASGIPPFRGPGGIWNDVDIEQWATAAAIRRDPEGCWQRHRELARLVKRVKPNAAHLAIAEFERRPHVGHVNVITQNVDSLHQHAGASNVIEIHGSLGRVKCSDHGCEGTGPAPDPDTAVDTPPSCPRCSSPMRYAVVLFDEFLPAAAERAARDALREAELFIAVGTSGVVFPAAAYVREAKYAGARTVLVNLEPPSPPNPYFDEVHIGRAELVLPELLGKMGGGGSVT